MASCTTIVNTALRKIGVVGAGREPRAADKTDTLAALQGMYTSWIAAGAFGRLADVTPTGSTYTPYCSSRIFRNGTPLVEISLPELVGYDWFYDYGWLRCCGEYNPSVTPKDGMCVVISDDVGGETFSWLYDGTIKQWQRLEGLDEDDDAPRSSADPLGLASCLAIEISDQFNGEVPQQTVRAASRYMGAMTKRFGMRNEPNYNPTAYL